MPEIEEYVVQGKPEPPWALQPGDRVRLVSTRYSSHSGNPVWGGEYGNVVGTLRDNYRDDWWHVDWDNLQSEAYHSDTLQLHT